MKFKKKRPGIFEISKPKLKEIIDMNHKLVKLSKLIDWKRLEEIFSKYYHPSYGRPAKSVRLMVGLHFLKYMYDLSDEDVVERWKENPYWQYFTGENRFQYEFPIHPTSMTKWRNRIKGEDLEKLLEETVRSGFKSGYLKVSEVKRVNVDTTVQEKNISYPRDIQLCYNLIKHLVRYAKKVGLKLKQTYMRVGKRVLREYGGHIHANQYKRAKKKLNKMKTFLGRLYREIERKLSDRLKLSEEFRHLSELYEKLLKQDRRSKDKIYSIHEPEVACIGKGKQHKKYEFGNKVGLVTSNVKNFILSCVSFRGNPYDGHTLKSTLSLAEKIVKRIGSKIREAAVDLGYRGHNYEGEVKVHIVKRKLRGLKLSFKKFLKRRSAIEAGISHLKRDSRLDRNYLKGVKGDEINAVLSACGYNLRLILAFLYFFVKMKWEEFEEKIGNFIKFYTNELKFYFVSF